MTRTLFLLLSFCVFFGPLPDPASAFAETPPSAVEDATPAAVPPPVPAPAPEPALARRAPQLNEFLATKSYEPGVSDRILLDYFGRFPLRSRVALELGVSLSFLEQWGPALVGASGSYAFENLRSEVVLGIQQERWPDWMVTENRAVLYWTFQPFSALKISAGMSLRAPQYSDLRVFSLPTWSFQNAELSSLFRVEGQVFHRDSFAVSVLVWNFDRMRLYTPNNIHFTLQPEYALKENMKLVGLIGTAVKGVSGGVVTFSQTMLSLGWTYAL